MADAPMVEDGRCLCCDLPVESCGTGLAKAQAAQERAVRQRALAQPGVTAAKYALRCATCSTRLAVGDPIRHTDDGWSGVLCCPDVIGE